MLFLDIARNWGRRPHVAGYTPLPLDPGRLIRPLHSVCRGATDPAPGVQACQPPATHEPWPPGDATPHLVEGGHTGLSGHRATLNIGSRRHPGTGSKPPSDIQLPAGRCRRRPGWRTPRTLAASARGRAP